VSYRHELRRLLCDEKIYGEYLKSVKLTVCASRSVAGRRLVEQENPSACAAADCKVCKQEINCIAIV
jgi:hypothetical protein